MLLAHPSRQYSYSSPSASPSPSPTTSAFVPANCYHPNLDIKGTYSIHQQPSPLDLNHPISSAESYYLDSRQSTPSDRFSYGPSFPDAQYMQNSSSHYPEVRVQQSTPSHSLPSATPPPLVTDDGDFPQPPWNYSNLVPSVQQQYTPTSFHSHKRLSSGSSIGSAGPDSPYTQISTYPHIVDPDTQSIHSAQLEPFEGSFAQYSKPDFSAPLQSSEQPLYPAFQNLNFTGDNGISMMAAQAATGNNSRQGRGSSSAERRNTSRRSYGADADSSADMRTNTPQLDRTMSDIYQDELFNPAMSQSAPLSQSSQSATSQSNLLSPQRAAFNQIIQAANHGHMSARSMSPTSNTMASRRSPFRETSKFAAAGFQQPSPNNSARLNSATQMRDRQKLESDAQVFAQHQSPARHDFMNTPKTISPKEALLDYHESAEDAKAPLFPSPKRESDLQQSATPYEQQLQRGGTEISNEQNFNSVTSSRRESPNYSTSSAPQSQGSSFTFMPPSVPAMPQQYPFISQLRRQSSSVRSGSDQVPEFPASLTSMESTKSDVGPTEHVRILPEQSPPSSQEAPAQRPADTSASSGTYTCTTPDCHSRFDTAAKLQKHRREAHRPSPISTSTPTTPSSATTPYNPQAAANNVSRNNQPGPHKCEKVNPSTGKPCNTIFSRSYDLTRHEDTIHNNRKQKVRCHLCTEEKTFSRNDALTRHMRVVHPDVDFPGKTRRGRNNEGVDVVRQRIEGGRAGR